MVVDDGHAHLTKIQDILEMLHDGITPSLSREPIGHAELPHH